MAAETPLNFRGGESSDQLKTASPAFASHVAYKVRRPLWTFMNYLDTGSSDNAEGMGAGAPEFGEVNTSEIGGVLVAASNDSYGQLVFLPSEIDLTKAIKFRVFFSESGTGGSGSAGFVFKYTPLTTGTTAVAIGATALGTAIAATTPSTTAHCLQATAWGTLAASTLSNAQGEDALATITTCTLTTITDATAYMLEWEYERRFIG
jgi:hypothetical protein